MPTTIISSNPTFKKEVDNNAIQLNIAELFADTIQGEGVTTGVPSTFMRLQHCTLNCVWCDTTEVWRQGNPYSIEEIFKLFDEYHLMTKFSKGQHLVITGGSPLKQQYPLEVLIEKMYAVYGFKPFIEVENEAVLMPSDYLQHRVNQWNNSPKLANSGMRESVRYKPEVLKKMSSLGGSWFKFVVDSQEDWKEIESYFLNPGYISKKSVILMPKGQTREELSRTREIAVSLAVDNNVRFSDREHINIWDKKVGV